MDRYFTLAIFAILLFLAGCGDEEEKTQAPVRSIKYMEVSATGEGQTRELSGVVSGQDKTQLSFQVSGNVQEVLVKVGDRVEKDQVLATLDETDLKLNLQEAKAQLAERQAQLVEKKQEYSRQKTLFEKGFASKVALDRATVELESAESALDIATTQIEKAQRDLSHTVLKAPFAGRIVKRSVEPFVEIAAGTQVFELESSDLLEVEVMVPESMVRLLEQNQPVKVAFPTLRDTKLNGVVTQIGSKADIANAFPVKVALEEKHSGVLSGMTAEVTFSVGKTDGPPTYLIPFTSVVFDKAVEILERPEAYEGFVFKYNPETQTIHKTGVKFHDVRGNMLEVFEGLNPGDIIATAGVHFLSDGQKVTLYEPTK